jgi:hypothetical protein
MPASKYKTTMCEIFHGGKVTLEFLVFRNVCCCLSLHTVSLQLFNQHVKQIFELNLNQSGRNGRGMYVVRMGEILNACKILVSTSEKIPLG